MQAILLYRFAAQHWLRAISLLSCIYGFFKFSFIFITFILLLIVVLWFLSYSGYIWLLHFFVKAQSKEGFRTNLNISDFFKKITHMWKRWGLPQNFILAFIDEPWKTRKIRILKKWKKIAGDIIILHMCTKNHNHMRYSSWDMEWDNFFWSFLAIFCPYSPLSLTIQKTKILKKWKKHLEMSSF